MRVPVRRQIGSLLLAVSAPALAAEAQQATDAEGATAVAPAPPTEPSTIQPTTIRPTTIQPTTIQPTKSQRDRREAAREEADRRLRETLVPTPMTAERFATLVAAIDPALAGNADLAAAFAAYSEEARNAIEATATRIADRMPAAYAFDPAREQFVARPNPELVGVLALRDRTAVRVLAAERALFRAIAVAAPAERRLRFAEERLGWLDERTTRDGLLPSTRLTLLEIVSRARIAPETLATAEPILFAHAEKLGGLLDARATTLRNGDARRAQIEVDAGTLWRVGVPDAVRETEARLAEVDDTEFTTEIAIRDLHFDTLDKLRARLPSREGRRVVEEWQRSVHPELFDDERLLGKLVEATIALPASSPETDAAILDAVETAYRRLEPLGREASRAADLILPRLLDRSDRAVLAEIAARQSVLAVQAKRRGAIRELVTRVRIILATSDENALAQITSMLETIAALERADAFDRASLAALAASLAARVADGSDGAEQTDEAADSSAGNRANPGQTNDAAPVGRPGQSDTRDSGASSPQSSPGNRGGRGSRRQQGATGGGA
jgi:hypothetical protein